MDENAAGPVLLPSADPTASQQAQANEFQERLLDRQDEIERTIIDLKHQGYSTADIADMTGWNIRKFQRFLKDLHDSLADGRLTMKSLLGSARAVTGRTR